MAPAARRSSSTRAPTSPSWDIALPGFDGHELARQVRARGATCRLIALTGYGRAEDKRRAREAGFDEHVNKPVTLEALAAMLR